MPINFDKIVASYLRTIPPFVSVWVGWGLWDAWVPVEAKFLWTSGKVAVMLKELVSTCLMKPCCVGFFVEL